MTTTAPTTLDDTAACCTPNTKALTPHSEVLGSCCATPSADTDTSSAIEEIKAQETPPEVASARSAGFRRLLETGRPVEMTDWATAAGMNETALQDVLDRPNVAGRVELDTQGRLLGIAGLTIEPTHHEVTIDGEKRWTWCALDAVGILGALDATAAIRSTDPRTGDAIEIQFVEGDPKGDAALFILGGYDGTNVREDWCPLVNFFTNTQEAKVWASEKELTGDIVSIQQVADEAATMWRSVTDPTPSNHT
jgi:alkylmercury lyase